MATASTGVHAAPQSTDVVSPSSGKAKYTPKTVGDKITAMVQENGTLKRELATAKELHANLQSTMSTELADKSKQIVDLTTQNAALSKQLADQQAANADVLRKEHEAHAKFAEAVFAKMLRLEAALKLSEKALGIVSVSVPDAPVTEAVDPIVITGKDDDYVDVNHVAVEIAVLTG